MITGQIRSWGENAWVACFWGSKRKKNESWGKGKECCLNPIESSEMGYGGQFTGDKRFTSHSPVATMIGRLHRNPQC